MFSCLWCVKSICYHDVTNNKLVKKTLKNIWIKLKLIFIKKEKFYIKKYFSEYLKCSEFKFLRISNINFYRTTPWSYWMNEPQCSSLCQCFVVYCNELLFCYPFQANSKPSENVRRPDLLADLTFTASVKQNSVSQRKKLMYGGTFTRNVLNNMSCLSCL